MFRIDDPTATSSLPAPETAGTPGYFTEGNPATSTAATSVRASFLNMLQEELISLLTAAGVSPSKTTYNQVLASVRAVALAQFTASIFSPGYVKFPNGVIIQWGSVSATATGVATTFPIAFPNALFNVTLTTVANSPTATGAAGGSTTGFTAYAAGSVATNYVAIGW